MLTVIEMKNENGKPVVVVTSDKSQHNLAIIELQSPEARRLAAQHAVANGVYNARVELPSAPYAVDATGEIVARPTEQTVAAFRVDIPISQGL